MKKRIYSLVLVLVMLCGTIVGCGAKEGNNASKDTLLVGLPQSMSVTDYDDNTFTQYVEENVGVNLEFQFYSSTGSEFSQQLSLQASSGERLPDVLWGFIGFDRYSMHDYGQDGYFLDLTELIDKYADNYKEQYGKLSEADQQLITNRGTDLETGAFYGMPMMTNETIDMLQNIMFINQTWLDAVGMQAPTNIDELYQVLYAFATKDPNGNGIADEIPMLGKASGITDICTYIINAFVYYDTNNSLNVTDGKVWAPYVTDEYREAIKFLNKLCSEGLFSDMSISLTTDNDFMSMIAPVGDIASVGIWCGHPVYYTNSDSGVVDQYVGIGPLADKTGKGGYAVVRPKELQFTAFITKDCKNTELAMKFLDFFYKDSTVTRVRHGVEGVDWEKSKGMDIYGNEVTTKIIGKGDTNVASNTGWGRNGNSILTYQNYNIIAETAIEFETMRNMMMKQVWTKTMASPRPAEVTARLTYTKEEEDIRSQHRGMLESYVVSSRNLFITGTMDPYDDTQWQEYINQVNNLKLDELIRVTQAAYDRENK